MSAPRVRLDLGPLEPRDVPAGWTPLPADAQLYVTGPGRDLPPVVRVYDAGTGRELNAFAAYAADFRGGVQVALGDVDGDRVPDVVTAPAVGGGPNVRVFSGRDGSPIANFFAYESSFRGGANVAVADLDGDGRGEIIVGAGVGGGPRVRVFRAADLAVLRDFFAYEPTFRGGVNVAAGDFGGSFGPAIVAGSGVGGGPAVRVFRYTDLQVTASFFAFDPAVRGGVFVAAGDLDSDGRADVVTGPGTGGPHVKVFDPAEEKEKLTFLAGPAAAGGVRVGVVPARGNADALIVTGSGAGAPAAVRLYTALDGPAGRTDPGGDPGNRAGVYVGG